MPLTLSSYAKFAIDTAHSNDLDPVRLAGDTLTLERPAKPAGIWGRIRGWFSASPEKQALAGLRRSLTEAYGVRIASEAVRPLRGARALQVQHLRQALAIACEHKRTQLVQGVAPVLLTAYSPHLLPAARAFVLALIAGSQDLVDADGKLRLHTALDAALESLETLSKASGLSCHSLEPVLAFAARGREGKDALALAKYLLDRTTTSEVQDSRGVILGTRVHAGMVPTFDAASLINQQPPAYNQTLRATILGAIQEDSPREVPVALNEAVEIAPFTYRDVGASTMVVNGRHWGLVEQAQLESAKQAFAKGLRDEFAPHPGGMEMALAVSRCMNQEAISPWVMAGLQQAFDLDRMPLPSERTLRAFEARPEAGGAWVVDAVHSVELHASDDTDRQHRPMCALFRLQFRITPPQNSPGQAAGVPGIAITFADVAFSN